MTAEKEVCPHCKGAREFVLPFVCMGCDGESEEHQHPAPERYQCSVCRGEGTVSPLQMAVYKARGGAPPVPFRGFA